MSKTTSDDGWTKEYQDRKVGIGNVGGRVGAANQGSHMRIGKFFFGSDKSHSISVDMSGDRPFVHLTLKHHRYVACESFTPEEIEQLQELLDMALDKADAGEKAAE